MSVHRLRPLAALDGCQLWLVNLDAPALPHEFDCLPAQELERAARFAFAVHRGRFLAGRAALRELLAPRCGRQPGDLRLVEGPHGKPHVQDAPGLRFNLSHSEGVGLVALAPAGGEVGVDIETRRHLSDALALAAVNFEPQECQALAALDGEARDRAFLLGWTRKEACLKALGSGFAGPARLDTGLLPDLRLVEWSGADPSALPHRAWVRSFELPEIGAVASLARLLERPASAAVPAGAVLASFP